MGKKKKKSKEELEEERRIAEEEETKRLEGPSAFVCLRRSSCFATVEPTPRPFDGAACPRCSKQHGHTLSRRCRPASTLPDTTPSHTRLPHATSLARLLSPSSSSLLIRPPVGCITVRTHTPRTIPCITRTPRPRLPVRHAPSRTALTTLATLATLATRTHALPPLTTPHTAWPETEEAKNKEAERLRKEQEERERQDHLARLRKEELARLRREEVEHADVLRDRRDTYSASCEAKERDEEWRKYVDCNPRPDASVESELNTYIKTTEESKEVDLAAVLRSCQYTEEVRASGRTTKEEAGGGGRWRVGMGMVTEGRGTAGTAVCSVGIGTREGEQAGTGQGSRSEGWW